MVNSGESHGGVFQKSILIILFLFLTAALVITWNSPSTGFEPSIYNSTPLVLWIAMISSVIVGVSIIIWSGTDSGFGRSNLWKYGFLLILLCYSIGLGLFIIRGYYLWAIIGDPASHLGWINEILQNGNIPAIIFYPITHILMSEISVITTLNPLSLYTIIPLFFSLLCVGFIYILVRVLSTNQIEPVIAAIISCTFLYGWYLNFTPNALSNMVFPLVLFLMFKHIMSKSFSWSILLYTFLFLYPVFHPVPSIMLGITLLTLWIPYKVHDLWNVLFHKNRSLQTLDRIKKKAVLPFLFLLIWSVFWLSLHSIWGYTLSQMYLTIRAEGEPTQGMMLTEHVKYAQFYGYDVIGIFLRSYGVLLLLSFLSVICFFVLWKTVLREQKQENTFSLYGPFGILCIIIPALFLFNLPFGPLRFIFYVGVLETVFVAYLGAWILIKSRKSKKTVLVWLTNIAMIVLLGGLFLNGILNLYPSPYTNSMTSQTTQSDVLGMTYFFQYHNVTTPVSGFHTPVGRFAYLLLSPQEKAVQNLPNYLKDEDRPPWHFGYDQFPSIAYSYDTETNLIIMQSDKSYYKDYFPEMAKYRITTQDFERLNFDSGVNLVYSNGGFDLLTITPNL
jgi:hypothetical protein